MSKGSLQEGHADLLGADVGGTKTDLALFEYRARQLVCARVESFPSQEADDLPTLLRRFLGGHSRLRAAVFGVAGPVQHGRAQITNLPWVVDVQELRALLRIDRVKLINDLEATAYGVLTLAEDDFMMLNRGVAAAGNAAVIAAGTGLGEGLLFWDGRQYHPSASEGGHADFAPRNDVQAELLAFLRTRFGRVSYERVLSGPGLITIYEFLRDSGRGDEPVQLARDLRGGDPATVISQAALHGGPAICVQALDLFTEVYGAEAGNLALKVMATSGVYVGGGIAPKIRTKLGDGRFMGAFRDKGRLRPLMEAIPVSIVLREHTALHGAGYCAARWAQREEGNDGPSA